MNRLFTTLTGRTFDLLHPRAEDVDFLHIAESLAKEARYNGATPGVFYSVAQHVVLGAEWIETHAALEGFRARKLAAAYFLHHDGHEAFLKDETTPKKRTLDAIAAEFGTLSGAVSEAYARLTERHDAAIHAAAGLAWPPPKEIAALVAEVDARMLLAEWAALRPGHDLPARARMEAEGLTPLEVTIVPWGWEVAGALLRQFMRELTPATQAQLVGVT